MTKEIDKHFKGSPAHHYIVSFDIDNFMVDWDMKRQLNNLVRTNSWEDLDKDGKKMCFKDHCDLTLPEWGLMLHEGY